MKCPNENCKDGRVPVLYCGVLYWEDCKECGGTGEVHHREDGDENGGTGEIEGE